MQDFNIFNDFNQHSIGFSIMCWFLTEYDTVHTKKLWKPNNPKIIKMFTSLKICYNIVNTVTGFFYYVLFSKFSNKVAFLLCAGFWTNMTKYTLKSGENSITQRAIKMFRYFNENLQWYKCKISCIQIFTMCLFLTRLDMSSSCKFLAWVSPSYESSKPSWDISELKLSWNFYKL